MFYNSSKFLEQLLFFGKMPFFTPKRQFSQKLGFWCMFWQFSYNKSASNSQNIQLNCADLKNWARDLIFFVGDHHTQYNGKMHEMEYKSKKVVFWATLAWQYLNFFQTTKKGNNTELDSKINHYHACEPNYILQRSRNLLKALVFEYTQ